MLDRFCVVLQNYLVIGDNWCISGQRIVNSWIRHQISLKLVEVHIQSSIESQGGSNRRDYLGNQSVEIGVGWSLNVKIPERKK